MKRVRLIALDMDGTLLLSDHHTVPQENIDAIREADRRGIRVAISTGRMVEDASDFIRRYDLPCMIVAANGARACTAPMPGGEWIYRCNLEPQDAHRALDLLSGSGLAVHGFEDGVVNTLDNGSGKKYHLVYRGLIEDRYGEAEIRAAASRGIMKLFAVGDGFAGDVYDARVEPTRLMLQKELPHRICCTTGDGEENLSVTCEADILRAIDTLLLCAPERNDAQPPAVRAQWRYHIG
jgi:hydroxymethylpyrimidine pyrophosphatase-like HAD family hydrolase